MTPGTQLFRWLTLIVGVGFVGLAVWGALLPASNSQVLFSATGLNASVTSALRFFNILFASYGVGLIALSRTGNRFPVLMLMIGADS